MISFYFLITDTFRGATFQESSSVSKYHSVELSPFFPLAFLSPLVNED